MKTKIFCIQPTIVFSILAVLCTHASTTLNKLIPSSSDESTELRYLTFGTSLTWGSVLKDRYKAYPWLLSSNVTNLAMCASDSSYPSMCTQSMVQDSTYDVIVIEYDRRRFEFLLNLVRRLRQRFPDATIVLTKMWSLMDVRVTAMDGKTEKLREWLGKSGKPFMSNDALNFVLSSDVTFSWDKMIAIREPVMEEAEKKYDAKIYSWDTESDMKNLIKSRFPLFADFVHLNESGHSAVAKELTTFLSEVQAKRSDRIGTWGDGDVCYSWFHDGLIADDHRKNFRFNNIQMNKFDEKNEKHALELKKKSTILHVYNPFDGPRNLYLTYMATYPNRIYPKVVVRCGSKQLTIIDPIAKYDFPVHVQDTRNVGMVNPGRNSINIQVLKEENGTIAAEAPFRLVGIVMTNEIFRPSNMFFKPLELES